ncbi:MAG: hypothetical protein V1794_03480, partial [Candidatus Glassbacteria bacterium]
FLLEGGGLRELATPIDSPEIVPVLSGCGIRLPWYASRTAGLRAEGKTDRVFFADESEAARLFS